MTPAHTSSAPTPSAQGRTSPTPSSGTSSLGTAPGEAEAPDTPKEAARKFEKVLVRQFTKVMTDDMFSGSLAGEGGGNWMESQRDRQRDWMTDMITEQLVEANTLGVSETLAQEWGAAGPNANSSSSDAQDSSSTDPDDSAEPDRPFVDPPPTTPNESHIDHAV